MTNLEKYENLVYFQEMNYGHKLTCTCGAVLEPMISDEVYLYCDECNECDYAQDKMPSIPSLETLKTIDKSAKELTDQLLLDAQEKQEVESSKSNSCKMLADEI